MAVAQSPVRGPAEAPVAAQGAGGMAREGVSVVIPAVDERGLARALRSVLAQDYDGPLEVVVADGSGAAEVGRTARSFPGVRTVANPGRRASAGLNRAIAATAHPVVARCDVHAELAPDYLRTAVATLLRTGAASVGGRQTARGETPFGRAVAAAMATRLGSGGAHYRTGGPAGPVDTVYLGVFRREALAAAGGFDGRLDRNEDYELNWRLRRNGGTVWFDPALGSVYRPRGTPRALARQYFDYGRGKRRTLVLHPRSWRARQLAPPLLVLGLGASALAGLAGAAGADVAPAAAPVLPVAWLGVLAAVALRAAGRPGAHALRIAQVLAIMHLAWGAGMLFGRRSGA